MQFIQMKQSIKEMLATHTKEEWHEWIDKEMEELGLEFIPNTKFNPNILFSEANDGNDGGDARLKDGQ